MAVEFNVKLLRPLSLAGVLERTHAIYQENLAMDVSLTTDHLEDAIPSTQAFFTCRLDAETATSVHCFELNSGDYPELDLGIYAGPWLVASHGVQRGHKSILLSLIFCTAVSELVGFPFEDGWNILGRSPCSEFVEPSEVRRFADTLAQANPDNPVEAFREHCARSAKKTR